jgi:hypothetical protein
VLIGDGVADGEPVAAGVAVVDPHAPTAMATAKAMATARGATLLDRADADADADADAAPIRLSHMVNIAFPPTRVAGSARGYHFGGCSPTRIVGRPVEEWR